MTKKCLLTVFLGLLPLMAGAQELRFERGDCMPVSEEADGGHRAGTLRRLPTINTQWDANKEYRQLVILVEYTDENGQFLMDDPKTFYNRMFNEPGYVQRKGIGCIADYFRAQSLGQLNLKFDVYGPYRTTQKSNPYANPTANEHNYGTAAMKEAVNLLLAEQQDVDFSVYDWNGDMKVEQVIFVMGGYCGNVGEGSYGYLWPNTSSFNTITTPGGFKISNYTCSAERFRNASNSSCGIGTICHEFSHSLGLPDIYPTGGDDTPYSVVDEWDLMDGGNFTNYGSCPPNFSPLERMLLGWLTPVDLTEPTSVKDLKPLDEGGEVYRIKHTDTEYLLLENRQWKDWDLGLPGKGLVIYHVNYVKSAWQGNTVNNIAGKPYYHIICADNMDYDKWEANTITLGLKEYRNSSMMNKYIFSTSAYPWSTDSTDFVNDALTDTSVPAAQMYTQNADGLTLLGKAITNITMSADGLVSFDFMGGDQTGISDVSLETAGSNSREAINRKRWYDLQGRLVEGSMLKKGLYVRNGKKVIVTGR